MKTNLNPNAQPWYPKGCNPNAPEFKPSLRTSIATQIPSQKKLIETQGAIGQSPVRDDSDGRELTPSIPIGPNLEAPTAPPIVTRFPFIDLDNPNRIYKIQPRRSTTVQSVIRPFPV